MLRDREKSRLARALTSAMEKLKKLDSFKFSAGLLTAVAILACLNCALRTPPAASLHSSAPHGQLSTNPRASGLRMLPWDVFNQLSPEPKPTQALVDENIAKKVENERKIYGGKRDPVHVGGFLQNDTQSYEPWLWDFLINEMKIESMVDVGCGRGISTHYFHTRGVRAKCFEGSPDGVQNSLVPQLTTLHDYTQGPIWTEDVVDIAWSVEFLEHIDRKFIDNYMATLKKARIVFASHSIWGGWHHVNVKKRYWWIELFRDYGFEYMSEFSEEMRNKCPRNHADLPDGKRGYTYFGYNGVVFRNIDIPWKRELHPWVNEEKTEKQIASLSQK